MPPQEQMERVQIALPSDQNYVCGLRVTAASMAKYASKNVILLFHILDGGIEHESFLEFQELILRLHPHAEILRHRVDESTFKDFPAWSGNRMTYARLMLAHALPDVDHIIYCDTDFLWLADIAQLWKLRDDSIIMQSVRDGCKETEEREQKWFVANGFPFDSQKYFCAGLSFYNLRLFRNENIRAQVSEFIRIHPGVRQADQTALNVILHDRVRLLDNRWQRLTMHVTAEELRTPIVLHYAGEVPWKRRFWWDLLTDSVMLWHEFNDELLGRRGSSLRTYFSIYQIAYKRILNNLMKFKLFRAFFYIICRSTGRGVYCNGFDLWVRDLRLKYVVDRYSIGAR